MVVELLSVGEWQWGILPCIHASNQARQKLAGVERGTVQPTLDADLLTGQKAPTVQEVLPTGLQRGSVSSARWTVPVRSCCA
jgi:hypothetical protein